MDLSFVFIFFGLLFIIIGGWLDMIRPCKCKCATCKKMGCNFCRGCSIHNTRLFGLSKMHYWIDGLALLVLAVLLRC